jgi:hypothetical protein
VATFSKGGSVEKIGNVINLYFEGNWMPIKVRIDLPHIDSLQDQKTCFKATPSGVTTHVTFPAALSKTGPNMEAGSEDICGNEVPG